MSDFGFSKRVAQSFVSARGALSEKAAKTFAQTADAFFKEFIDGRNLTETTMNYLKALNVLLLPSYVENDHPVGIPPAGYLRLEDVPASAIPAPAAPKTALISDYLRARIELRDVGSQYYTDFIRPYAGESEDYFAQRVEGYRLKARIRKTAACRF
ncbi:MAG: hypothetical protein LBF86_00495 [Helicobacteraceae bacterium]|jgi:hypothetical protein|nr:hypothetical protein [Helicobacteraceae bacterium]